MTTYIALIRGINVGGSHKLPMRDLKLAFEQNGCSDVRTYIQSGNVVFRSTTADAGQLATRLAAAVSKSHGFEPNVIVLTRDELEKAAAANPFPEADNNPKSVHLFFLAASPPRLNPAALEAARAPSEHFELKGRVFFLHTPDGFGTSKLAARVESLLGVPATARNWRTVTSLLALARSTP